jgi:hypothetical protein
MFFPGESSLLNYYFYQTLSLQSISLHHRFLLYQIHQVIGLRQSSASPEITQKIIELNEIAQNGISMGNIFELIRMSISRISMN